MYVTPELAIQDDEIQERFVHAGGPGGQNVNKVATAVELRFDVAASPSLPPEVRDRVGRLAGRRMNREGVLVIQARRYRTRERNRQDATQRLLDLLRRATETEKPRRPTKPSRRAKERRLQDKHRRSEIKRQRGTQSLT